MLTSDVMQEPACICCAWSLKPDKDEWNQDASACRTLEVVIIPANWVPEKLAIVLKMGWPESPTSVADGEAVTDLLEGTHRG